MPYQQNLIASLIENKNSNLASEALNALKVYKNNYLETGVNALSIGFPSVHHILGQEDFRRLALGYLKAYPKSVFDWADYGESLADYMYSLEALAELPFLPELADADWRCLHIERAADISYQADSFSLLNQDLDSVYFVPAPGLQIYKAIFPIVELRQISNTQPDFLNNLNLLLNNAIKSPMYRSIILWRQNYKAMLEYCDDSAYQAFIKVVSGQSVANVLSVFGEDQLAMSNWLQEQIQSKKIYAIKQ